MKLSSSLDNIFANHRSLILQLFLPAVIIARLLSIRLGPSKHETQNELRLRNQLLTN